jgi:preprotein translocase subunit SecE
MKVLGLLREAYVEVRKVKWPTKRETALIVAIVAVVVLIASLFFLVVDYAIYNAIDFFLSLGGR